MDKYLETHLNTGSAMPKKPVSKRTEGPAKGTGGTYSPSAAASHLEHEDKCAPHNGSHMSNADWGK